MNIKNYKKAFLIVIYEELGQSNTKMFNEIVTMEKAKELGFEERSKEENNKFVRKWLKEHKVKMCDYKTIIDFKEIKRDENFIPIIVEKKNNGTR